MLAPGLGLKELADVRYPNLAALAASGAVGLMNVTNADWREDLASACLTLGSGERRAWRPEAPGEPPLLLGERFQAAGRRVCALTVGSRWGGGELLLAVGDATRRAAHTPRPAFLSDLERPFGVAADLPVLLRAARRSLDRCDLLAVDPGDLERARRYAPFCLPERAAAHAHAARRDLDRLIGALWPQARSMGGQLFLVSPVAGTDGPWGLGLLVAAGPPWPRGLLTSPSTRLPGLVTNLDLLPTLLAQAGLDGADLAGRPFRSTGAGGLGELERLARWSARAETARGPAWDLLRAGLIALLLLSALTRVRSRLRRTLLPAALWLFLVVLLAGDLVAPPGAARAAAHAVLVGLAVAAGWALSRWELPLLGALVLLLLGDLSSGGHLLRWSPLGHSVALGARYYGIGNELAGLLLGVTLLLPFAACSAARHAPRARRRAAWAGVALYGLVIAAVGSPVLGANFGGALAAALVFALAVPVLLGLRARVRHVALALGVLLLAGMLFALWDARRPPEAQSHVGRLIAAARHDRGAPLARALAGKAQTAARVTFSLWGLLLLGELVVGLWLLRRATLPDPSDPSPLPERGLRLLLPAAAGMLLFNDSGVIGAALALALLPAGAAALPAPEEPPG